MTDRAAPPFRVGHGYDLHRLEPTAPRGRGRPFVLGGVAFPDHPTGPAAHSDGDALLHAITDAILGALGEPDIGRLFPDNDPVNAGRDSADFLREAVHRMRAAAYELGNLDATVICEKPKIGPRRDAIVENLAALIGCDRSRLNVKGKTHEQVDAVGEGRAVEVHVAALLIRLGSTQGDTRRHGG